MGKVLFHQLFISRINLFLENMGAAAQGQNTLLT